MQSYIYKLVYEMGRACSLKIHSKFQLGHLMGMHRLGDLNAGGIIIAMHLRETGSEDVS